MYIRSALWFESCARFCGRAFDVPLYQNQKATPVCRHKTFMINSHLQRMFGSSYPEQCVPHKEEWAMTGPSLIRAISAPKIRLFWRFCGFEMPKYGLRTRGLHTLTLRSQ